MPGPYYEPSTTEPSDTAFEYDEVMPETLRRLELEREAELWETDHAMSAYLRDVNSWFKGYAADEYWCSDDEY